jgi:hypothetical protein
VASQIIAVNLLSGLNLPIPIAGFIRILQQFTGLLPGPERFFHYAKNLKKMVDRT